MRTLLISLLTVLSCLGAEPLRVVTRVKLEGVLVDRSDATKPPVRISEEYDTAASRGPLLALMPGGDIECVLGSSDPESILSKRLAVPTPLMADLDSPVLQALGFSQPRERIEFFGFNNGESIAFDAYYTNGWLWLSGGRKIRYLGSADNPFMGVGESIDLAVPLYSWNFIQNGDSRACSPPRGKGPEGTFLVLVERGDCLFHQKAQNAALAGAAGVVLYDSETSDTFPGGYLSTPGAAIPSVLVRRTDGLDLVKAIADTGQGRTNLTLRPANLMGTLTGSIQGDELKLNLVLSEAWDSIFVGTLTGRVPQVSASKLRVHSAAEQPVAPHRKRPPLAQ